MNRIIVFLLLFAVAGFAATAQEAAPASAEAVADKPVAAPADPIAVAFGAIRSGQLETAEKQLDQIRNPPAKLFVQACIEQAEGDLIIAHETVTQLIVRYPNDPVWTARGELLSAALYMELGMTNSADVTARQIQQLYEGTDVAKKADALRSEIEQLKNEVESK